MLSLLRYAVFAPLALWGLAACQTRPADEGRWRYFDTSAVTQVVLHQPLTIPPDSARAYVQSSRQVSGVNQYHPHCKFNVYHVRDGPQVIQPDIFQITRIKRYSGINFTNLPYRQTASVSLLSGDNGGDGARLVMFSTELSLQSSRQPEVMTLICQYFDEPALGRYLSLAEIRSALGAIATLNGADPTSGRL